MHPMISFEQLQLMFKSYNLVISQICGWQRENNQCICDKSEFYGRLFLATTNVVPSTLIVKEGETL